MRLQDYTGAGQFPPAPNTITLKASEKPLNREVLVSVIADMEKSVAEGINEACRLADNLGGTEASECTEASPAAQDVHARLYRLRSAIYELLRQIGRSNNVVAGS